MLSIDVFWSFRSPWSYLATGRLRSMQDTYELEVVFRPVYPIAIRTPDFFLQVNPMWPPYLVRDAMRVAEMLEIPYAWPNPDPVKQYRGDDGRARTAEDQPYIHRLTRLGILAAEQGQGIEFADEISRVIWGGTANWHEGDHLAMAAERAGLTLSSLDQAALVEEERLEGVIESNQSAHEAVGHWGVPTFSFAGEPFFGQDRIDVLLWRLRQSGLSMRT
ncbi:MAG: 2-hydroxychromene-2-carboxylate isomerase [Candidatus Azotimanducaceae bacterium]|jgi:2-hydroxychromene-2-carboxylate isomerase